MVSAILLVTACKSVDPVTGQKVYDAAKTERAKAIFVPQLKEGIRQVYAHNQAHREEITAYLKGAQNIFCTMEATKQFKPAYLISEADKLGTPLLARKLGNQDILRGKDLVIALYELNFGDAGTLGLSEEGWGYQLTDTFCRVFTESIAENQ